MAYEIPSYLVKPPIKGQRCDLAPYDVPTDSANYLNNFVRRNGIVVVRPGYTQLGGSLTNRVTGLYTYTHSSGGEKLVAATSAGWFAWDVPTKAWVDITEGGNGLATTIDDFQSFRIFYKSGTSYLVGVNGYADHPKKWDGTASNYSDVGGSPGHAKCICSMANRMILGNFSNAPLQIDVSAFNDFESGWGTTQTVVLADTPGPIIEMREMGALVSAIYKSDAWYLCTAVAGSYPFNFSMKQADISGPMSPASVVSTPLGHYILARDCNVYRCDGASYVPLGDHIRNHVADNIGMDKFQRSFGFYDKSKNEVWFFWVGAATYFTSPTIGIVIKLSDNTVWPVSFNMDYIQPTAGLQCVLETASTLGALGQPLGNYTQPLGTYGSRQSMQVLGTNNGKIAVESGNTDLGDDIGFDYGSGFQAPSEERKFVTLGQIELYFKRSTGKVWIEIGYSDENTDNLTGYTLDQIDLGNKGPHVLGTRVTSRFFQLWVVGQATGPIQYEGARLSGVERGRR